MQMGVGCATGCINPSPRLTFPISLSQFSTALTDLLLAEGLTVKGTMKYVYIACFLALVQVATCQDVTSTTDLPEQDTTVSAVTELPENETISFSETEVTSTTTNENSTTEMTTADGLSTESVLYSTVTDDTTTKEEQSTTVPKPVHGIASLVHPSVLAIIVPLSLRVFSTNLVAVV